MIKLIVYCNNLGKRQSNKKKRGLSKSKALTDASVVYGKKMQVLTNTKCEYATVI